MKKIIFLLWLSFALLNADELGFNGKIFLGGGALNIQSRVSPLANQDYLQDYHQKHSRVFAVPIIGLELSYKPNAHNHFFLKNFNGRDISGLALGYELSYLKEYKTTFELVSSIREKTYKNPYDLNTKRDEISANKYGARLTQSYLFNERSSLYASYLFAVNNIRNEQVPYKNLRRESVFHQLEMGLRYPFLNLSFNYDFNDAKGVAQAFTRYGTSIGANLMLAKTYIISPNASFNIYENKGTNFIFNKKQRGQIYKLGLNLSKLKFLGYEDLYTFVSLNLNKKDSNINFYDETYQIFLLGFGYKF